MTRRERVEHLLEHWQDFFDVAGSDGGGSDGGPALLPGMSQHPSVVELARCIGVLRERAPKSSMHLMAFYTAPFKIEWVRVKLRGPQGKMVLSDPRPTRVRQVPSWVRAQKVRRCVDMIAGTGDHRHGLFRGSPWLPNELLPCVHVGCLRHRGHRGACLYPGEAAA